MFGVTGSFGKLCWTLGRIRARMRGMRTDALKVPNLALAKVAALAVLDDARDAVSSEPKGE